MSALEKNDSNHVENLPTEKNFGIVMVSFFSIVGLFPLFSQKNVRVLPLVVSAILALITIFKPKVLHFPNLIWFKLGLTLNKIVSPIILGFVFYLIFTPFGFLIRSLKKDYFQLEFRNDLTENKKSFWNVNPAQPNSMKDQF